LSHLFFQLVLAAQAVFDQIEQEKDQDHKDANQQGRADIPEIWQGLIAKIGDFLNGWKDLLVSETVEERACNQTQNSREEVIKFAFAGPGGTGAWSVPGERHSQTEDQSAEQISKHIGGGDVGKLKHSCTLHGV
jgi:hypothetical protein